MVMGCQLTGWWLFFGGGEGVALTVKQERFVEEYLVDLNATQAAIRAGSVSYTHLTLPTN